MRLNADDIIIWRLGTKFDFWHYLLFVVLSTRMSAIWTILARYEVQLHFVMNRIAFHRIAEEMKSSLCMTTLPQSGQMKRSRIHSTTLLSFTFFCTQVSFASLCSSSIPLVDFIPFLSWLFLFNTTLLLFEHPLLSLTTLKGSVSTRTVTVLPHPSASFWHNQRFSFPHLHFLAVSPTCLPLNLLRLALVHCHPISSCTKLWFAGFITHLSLVPDYGIIHAGSNAKFSLP